MAHLRGHKYSTSGGEDEVDISTEMVIGYIKTIDMLYRSVVAGAVDVAGQIEMLLHLMWYVLA